MAQQGGLVRRVPGGKFWRLMIFKWIKATRHPVVLTPTYDGPDRRNGDMRLLKLLPWLVSMIFAFGVAYSRLSGHETRLTMMESKEEKHQDAIVSLQADVRHIMGVVDRIDRRMSK